MTKTKNDDFTTAAYNVARWTTGLLFAALILASGFGFALVSLPLLSTSIFLAFLLGVSSFVYVGTSVAVKTGLKLNE